MYSMYLKLSLDTCAYMFMHLHSRTGYNTECLESGGTLETCPKLASGMF